MRYFVSADTQVEVYGRKNWYWNISDLNFVTSSFSVLKLSLTVMQKNEELEAGSCGCISDSAWSSPASNTQ